MNADRAALVVHARESIAVGSKSFSAAARLFDPVTRERAWLLYAWCRRCDDIADGQVAGHTMSAVADPHARIAEITALTDAALDGRRTNEPAFDALGLVVAETGIPRHLPHDVIAGFRLDAAGWRPQTEDDLLRYCYHVAGAVGVMMAVLMGVDPHDEAVLDRACDLGLAFQLANIARDLREDEEAGRRYLPADWLRGEGLGPDAPLWPARTDVLARFGTRLATMAARYEASARVGAAALPPRAAWAVLAAAGIYGDIARVVARRGAHAWDARVFTTKAAKLGWLARARWQAARRQHVTPTPRDGLWTRPRA